MSARKVESIVSILADRKLLDYGSQIPINRFEELFDFKRNAQEFSWLISMVRRALYERGLYLSGEGSGETGFYSILPASENFYIGKLAMARAERDLDGKLTLLCNTSQDGFTLIQKQRHENTLRILSLRLSALRKVQEHNRELDKKRKEIVDSVSEEE